MSNCNFKSCYEGGIQSNYLIFLAPSDGTDQNFLAAKEMGLPSFCLPLQSREILYLPLNLQTHALLKISDETLWKIFYKLIRNRLIVVNTIRLPLSDIPGLPSPNPRQAICFICTDSFDFIKQIQKTLPPLQQSFSISSRILFFLTNFQMGILCSRSEGGWAQLKMEVIKAPSVQFNLFRKTYFLLQVLSYIHISN